MYLCAFFFSYSNLSKGVLGFGCEWVKEGPVSLLQLSTYTGIVVLFRIGKIGFIPKKLKVRTSYFYKTKIYLHVIIVQFYVKHIKN